MKLHAILSLICITIILKADCSLSPNSTILLLSHHWCRKCDKAVIIMEKLQVHFNTKYKQQSQKDKPNHHINVQLIHFEQDFLNPNYPNFIKNNSDSNLQDAIQVQLSQKQKLKKQKVEKVQKKIAEKYNLAPSQIPFPTIWISCPNFEGIYQNELTYQELLYWIGVYCEEKIPKCQQNPNNQTKNKGMRNIDYQFKLHSSDWISHRDQIIQFQVRYSFVKLCILQTNQRIDPKNRKQNQFKQIQNQLSEGPLFFSHFDHNLRNYLYKQSQNPTQQKLAIFLLFNSASHPKVKQFIDIYKFISDSLHGDKQFHQNEGKLDSIFLHNISHKAELYSQYHHSSMKNYGIKKRKSIFKNIVFVGACYTQAKADCIMKYQYNFQEGKQQREKDPSQRPIITKYQVPFSFKGTKPQNIKRLLQFSHTKNIFQSSLLQEAAPNPSMAQLIAFHFDKQSHRINSYEFESFSTKLGNQFLFWIQSVYQKVFHKQNHEGKRISNDQQNYCLSSKLVHFISERNLSAIKSNVRMSKFIKKLNSGNKQHIKFETVVMEQQVNKMPFQKLQKKSRWKAEYFQLCLKDKSMVYLTQSEAVIKILSLQIKQKLDQMEDMTNNSLLKKRRKQRSAAPGDDEL